MLSPLSASADPDSYRDCGLPPTKATSSADGGGARGGGKKGKNRSFRGSGYLF